MKKLTLQEEFFEYIQRAVEYYYPNWTKRPTNQWYNCYAQIENSERVIIWIRKPNKDGTFWIFVSISSKQIETIPEIVFTRNSNDQRKFHASNKKIKMIPIEILDRGIFASNPWEANWPVGIKIVDRTQFELAKLIIVKQWQ